MSFVGQLLQEGAAERYFELCGLRMLTPYFVCATADLHLCHIKD